MHTFTQWTKVTDVNIASYITFTFKQLQGDLVYCASLKKHRDHSPVSLLFHYFNETCDEVQIYVLPILRKPKREKEKKTQNILLLIVVVLNELVVGEINDPSLF